MNEKLKRDDDVTMQKTTNEQTNERKRREMRFQQNEECLIFLHIACVSTQNDENRTSESYQRTSQNGDRKNEETERVLTYVQKLGRRKRIS